jgi:epsilon-lactone hydrolase
MAREAETGMAAAPAAPVRRPAPQVNRNAVLAVVAVAQFMVLLDATIVNVALPTIQRDLGIGLRPPRCTRPKNARATGHSEMSGRIRRFPAAQTPTSGTDAMPDLAPAPDWHGRMGLEQPNPTKGRSSMSTQQRETLDAILRQSAFPVGSDVNEQRRLLREAVSAQPLPADVTVTAAALGGVPTAEITVDGIEPRYVVLYFHGGVYVMSDAFLAAGLASQVGRRTHAKVISVDYRLAPEHRYPAAVDDALAAYEALLDSGIAPSDIAFAGESAGGGLAVATLVNARDHGLALPAAAFVMSPYVDLTLAGTTMETKRDVDPLLSRELLQPRVADYAPGQDAALGLISPVFADLSGLPPLIIQAGSHEVLLDDAVRLARQAATADVEVTLDITPRVPHVFQAYSPMLDEAAAALDRAGQLLSAHLAGAERTIA